MDFIEGVGGAFVFSHDPQRLADWYAENLGMVFEGGGGSFYQTWYGLDPDAPARKLDTTFSILRAHAPTQRQPPEVEPVSMYGDQPFMVNLRSRDLDALLAHLEAKGVRILDHKDESYGKFAWVRDADGNRVELYQSL